MSATALLSGMDELDSVLAEFLSEIDPLLLDEGWGFDVAKGVDYGQTDQSMVNHVRNGVFALVQLNTAASTFDAHELDESDLRRVVALFVIHDLHKHRDEETTAHTEYDIDKDEVESLVRAVGVDEFAPSLRIEDFHACAVDHENSWKSNPEQSTRTYDRLRPFVRIADAFASCETPESAGSERNERALDETYPGSDLVLRTHVLDDVKGVFTNLLNGVIARELGERLGYELLLIYQDGCVYLAEADGSNPVVDDTLVEDIYHHLTEQVSVSHPAYDDRQRLAESLGTDYAHNYYSISPQYFFYAGPANVLLSTVVKGVQDANPESVPTDKMCETIADINQYLSREIDDSSRVVVGYARLVATVKREFVDPLVDRAALEGDAMIETAQLFGVGSENITALREIRDADDVDPTAGGKWDYGYVIGQHVADMVRQNGWSPAAEHLAEYLLERLQERAPEWQTMVMTEHAGEFETELTAYIADVLRVNGRSVGQTAESNRISDPFEEHHAIRRGKTCTFCNRGTTSGRKSDMESPKSLTTFQAGYSNRIPADAGKPENLLACIPCQVEFSLRETGATQREAGRLFIHLVPDYFYTPTMWSLYADQMFARFTGEAMTRMGRLASAIFDATANGGNERTVEESLTTVIREATKAEKEEGGCPMIEQLSQEFDPDAGFGTQTFSFYKPKDNEAEFQFFGVFLGLSIAAAMGTRVYITQSPLPDLRGRDFQAMAKLDAGFSRVADFYGQEIPLSVFRERLGAAAALVQLGYELARDDARFPKYLRMTRNKPLPGSYLLKKAARDSESGSAPRYLLAEAEYLDRHASNRSRTESRLIMTDNE